MEDIIGSLGRVLWPITIEARAHVNRDGEILERIGDSEDRSLIKQHIRLVNIHEEDFA